MRIPLGALILVLCAAAPQWSRAEKSSYGPAGFALELDHKLDSRLAKVSGGTAPADVSKGKAGAEKSQDASGHVRLEPLKVKVAGLPGDGLSAWIKDALKGSDVRKSGTIIASDAAGVAQERREFENALLTEIEFPGVDAESKDSASVSATLQPEVISSKKTPGEKVELGGVKKELMASKFRLHIEGLGQVGEHALKIEPLRVSFSDGPNGRKLEVPNLIVTFSADQAEALMKLHEGDVIKGEDRTSDSNGTLEYLSADKKETLLTLDLKKVGLFKLMLAKGGKDASKDVKAEFYFERLGVK